jgi:hypothetical protein
LRQLLTHNRRSLRTIRKSIRQFHDARGGLSAHDGRMTLGIAPAEMTNPPLPPAADRCHRDQEEEGAVFGTIGHARLKAGRQDQLAALQQEWQETIRPKIPGDFVQLVGHADGQPDHLVFVALAQDRDTYRRLAELPEQDAWYRRLIEHIDGDVQWEDVAMELGTKA